MQTAFDTKRRRHTLEKDGIENKLNATNTSKENNELLRKMDKILLLLVEHCEKHEGCCLKNVLKLIGDRDE